MSVWNHGREFTNPYSTWNPTPVFAISKTANTNAFRAGTNNTYTIQIQNQGGPAKDLVLSDVLPAGVAYVPNSTVVTIPSANVTQTLRDHFNLLPVSYSVNNGSVYWASNWTETADDNLPQSGEISINGSRLYFLEIETDMIHRAMDLSMAQSATLEFDWQTVGLTGTEYLDIQLSSDGVNYNSVGTLNGTTTGHFTYTIPNTYLHLRQESASPVRAR